MLCYPGFWNQDKLFTYSKNSTLIRIVVDMWTYSMRSNLLSRTSNNFQEYPFGRTCLNSLLCEHKNQVALSNLLTLTHPDIKKESCLRFDILAGTQVLFSLETLPFSVVTLPDFFVQTKLQWQLLTSPQNYVCMEQLRVRLHSKRASWNVLSDLIENQAYSSSEHPHWKVEWKGSCHREGGRCVWYCLHMKITAHIFSLSWKIFLVKWSGCECQIVSFRNVQKWSDIVIKK